MTIKLTKQEVLRSLPAIDKLLADKSIENYFDVFDREIVSYICRKVVEDFRQDILIGKLRHITPSKVFSRIIDRLEQERLCNFSHVINATGVVLHTNLGRAPLSQKAKESVIASAFDYSNLEYRLNEGARGTRQEHLKELLCMLTGAEDAYVVNNNAGAVMLVLNTLGFGKEVIVSRGHLIEIGGSFRLPDVMKKSNAKMIEVGSTNKTHLKDYAQAINPQTSLLFFTHWSNFAMIGFVENPTRTELVELGKQYNLPVVEDLGSGSLINLEKYGLIHEPTPQESLKAGVAVVTFSGDKLTGGPQAGIIVGKREFVDKIRKNQMARALRIDKMTVAALEATLKHYLKEEEAVRQIPILRMLTMKTADIATRAQKLYQILKGLVDGRVF